MRNTFSYDIDEYIRSPEGQKDLRERRAELVRMQEDPKTPQKFKRTIPRTLRFIDLYLQEE